MGHPALCSASEIEEGEGGKDLEEARVVGKGALGDEAVSGVIDLEVEAGEIFVRDLFAVDLDTLVDADEVRRGVESGAIAGGGQDAAERGGGAAFAVGSGDEDSRKGALRIAKGSHEGAHMGEVEFAARGGGRGMG